MLVPDIFGRNVFDDFFGDPFRGMRDMREPGMTGLMKTDVKETEGGYELAVELPGFKKEDIKAELHEGYMTVTAETSSEDGEKDDNGRYIRRERYSGSCSRTFFVGKDVKEEDIKARFADGVLVLDIPKPQEKPELPQKKLIQIEG